MAEQIFLSNGSRIISLAITSNYLSEVKEAFLRANSAVNLLIKYLTSSSCKRDALISALERPQVDMFLAFTYLFILLISEL